MLNFSSLQFHIFKYKIIKIPLLFILFFFEKSSDHFTTLELVELQNSKAFIILYIPKNNMLEY